MRGPAATVVNRDDLPCRHFCAWPRSLGCAPGKCGLAGRPFDDPKRWLGRGSQDVPGKSFGWAHNKERDAIRTHLRRRLWRFGLDDMAAARLEFQVTKIQQRLQRDYHRRKPPVGARRVVSIPTNQFTTEELQHLVDLFSDANDPISAEIARKAAAQIRDKR